MIEGIAWPTVGVAGAGWLLASICVLMIFRGQLITRREAEAKDRTIEAQQRTIDEQGRQLSLMLGESMPTVNNVLTALHKAAALPEERTTS